MKMMNRKPANGKGFKKEFSRTKQRMNPKNLPVRLQRGGYRL